MNNYCEMRGCCSGNNDIICTNTCFILTYVPGCVRAICGKKLCK